MKVPVLRLFMTLVMTSMFPTKGHAQASTENLAYVYSCDGDIAAVSLEVYKEITFMKGVTNKLINKSKDGCPLTSLFASHNNPPSLFLITPLKTEISPDGATGYQLNWIDGYSGRKIDSVIFSEPLIRFPEILDVTKGSGEQYSAILKFSTEDDEHIAKISLQPKTTDDVVSLVANEEKALSTSYRTNIQPSPPEWALKYLPEPGWMPLQLWGFNGVFVRETKDNTQFATLESANDFHFHKLSTLSSISASRLKIASSGEHLFALAGDNTLWKLNLHPLEVASKTHIDARREDTKVLCVSDFGAFVRTSEQLFFVKGSEMHPIKTDVPIDDQLQCVFEKKQ